MNHSMALASPAPEGDAPRSTPATSFLIEQFERGEDGRASLEAFISASFRASYGAEVKHFSDVLLGSRDAQGNWIAALGYSRARSGPLFLEQYLDLPLEAALAERLQHPVARGDIVEVGNLASTHPGAARALILRTTRLLYGLGLRWVAFTATPSLLNSFSRLRLQPQVLAPADPARLPDGGQSWGSYYQSQPKVMFGDIHYGYSQIA